MRFVVPCVLLVSSCTLKSGPAELLDARAIDAPQCDVGDWWDQAFSRRQAISFRTAAALTDFPVLVVLTPENFDYSAAAADGADLRFVAADGSELAHELEQWSPGASSSVWVKLPTIQDSIELYYGNPGATDTSRAASVWSNEFASVWHMRDDSGGQVLDSSANANNGTRAGSPTPSAGLFGAALTFNGVDSYIETAPSQSYASANLTLEAVVNVPDPGNAGFRTIFEHNRRGANWYGLWRSGNGPVFHFRYQLMGTLDFVDTVDPGTWYYVAATIDATAATATTYIDGVVDGTETGVNVPSAEVGRVLIGVADLDPLDEFFDGAIDEVRVSTTVRSAEWIETQHRSMTDDLVTYGGAETLCAD